MKRFPQAVCLFILSIFLFVSFWAPSFSIDLQSATYSLGAETKDVNSITEARKVNELMDELEKNWNEHNIEKIIKFYSDDFVNGDGLNLEAVKELTKELWEGYPDVVSKSQDRSVRVYGEYATVESTDFYQGNSAKPREEVGSQGVLKAVSIGQVFLKKFGPTWKITSDKTIFEKVNIGYGLGSELIDQNKITLSAPEQVSSGQQYTVRLDFNIQDEIKPVAAISKEVLVYPQVTSEDKFRLISEQKLERLLSANRISKNELVTATVGLTGGALKPKLLGLVFLTKRVNVIPISEQTGEISIIKTPAKSALNKTIDLLDVYQTQNNEQKTNQKQNETNKENKPDSDIKE